MLENKEDILIKKINRLIEKNQQLDTEIIATKQKIEFTREAINRMKTEFISEKNEEGKILSFIKVFCIISKKIIKENLFIPYTYETKYSGDYYKIEKGIYEEIVCQFSDSDIELEVYLKYCQELRLIKTEKGKNYFNSGGKKVYYVSRAFMDAANREDIPKGE